MITEMATADVIALGGRNRAPYLLEQYEYTMKLAKNEGEDLENLLPAGYLGEVEKVAEEVHSAYKEKSLSTEDSKDATQAVNDLLRKAKVWRRAVVSRANRAKRLGKNIPDSLLTADGTKGVPAITSQMDTMVKLATANAGSLPGKDTAALVSEGQTLLDKIRAVDADQEVKRFSTLPDAVKNFYYRKGLLYIGIKVLNDAGRELHADEPTAAAKYNLSILYRSGGKRKTAPAH